MDFEFAGIILQDKLFALEDVVPYCKSQVENKDTPDWQKDIFAFILDFLDDNEYVVQYSSGTTGKPKQFLLPKKSMIESAKLTCKELNLTFGQKSLLCLPINYIAGKMMIVRAFVAGLNLFWEEPSSMPSLAKHGKIDFCAMVPIQVYNSFSNYEFINNIKTLIVGGAELRSELLAMFRDVKNNTYETYGMTETCSHIALRKINGTKPDSHFKTLPGVTVGVDKRGCLNISVPFIDEKIQTNDLVELISDTQFDWKGRYDNLINSGGIKINPEDLEANITSIIDSECAVLGVPDTELGNKLVLYIEEGKGTIEIDLVTELLKENLEQKLVPKEIYYLRELPRTSSFKIDRKKLSSLY